MPKKIVVGYDASGAADTAVEFAVGLAKAQGAEIVIAHVLEWSPYSFLTPEEIEERHQRRNEELQRASSVLEPIAKRLADAGIEVSTEVKYGHIAETLIKITKSVEASQIIVGRTGHSNLSTRLFGSVAGSLAQASPVPVTIVP